MRIDYSEPKKSYVAHHGSGRVRKESSSLQLILVIGGGVALFLSGFGSGWVLSQKAAKKSFQAAMAQTSIENAPKKEALPQPPQAPVQEPPRQQPEQAGQVAAPSAQQPPATAQKSTSPEPAAAKPQADAPLSFYKTLPGGQKNTPLGSGINSSKPLQAAIPSNVTRPPAADQAKQGADSQHTTEKPVAKQGDAASSFTVQIASYPLRSEAETHRGKLVAKGYQVSIVESNQGDKGTWYRVRVGSRLTQEAAKELAGKLGRSAMVIPDR